LTHAARPARPSARKRCGRARGNPQTLRVIAAIATAGGVAPRLHRASGRRPFMGHRWLAPAAALISLATLMVVVLVLLQVPIGGAGAAVGALSLALPLAFVFAHAQPGSTH
jgi:hypothetical protein